MDSGVSPSARLSKITDTMMRVPLIQGLPLQTPGFALTRSCQFISVSPHALAASIARSALGLEIFPHFDASSVPKFELVSIEVLATLAVAPLREIRIA